MQSGRILDLSKICLGFMLVMLPLCGYYAATVKIGSSQVTGWLPADDAVFRNYRDFLEKFGDDQILLVSWEGCTLEDPRLLKVTRSLRDAMTRNQQLPIGEIENSVSVLKALGESGLTPAAAYERLEGWAIGVDGTAFITIQVEEGSEAQLGRLVDMVRKVSSEAAGFAAADLILAGEPYRILTIDRSSRETVEHFVLPSTFTALLVAWCCLGQLRTTAMVLAFAGTGQLVGLAIISGFVGQMSTVLIVVPTLVFMLTLSAAIHLVNYYRDLGGDSHPQAGVGALILGAKPCVLATLTTGIGFGSLTVSELTPVWRFGALAALGLTVSSAVLLSTYPAACLLTRLLGNRRTLHAVSPETAAGPRVKPRWRALRLGEYWLASFTRRYALGITLVGVLCLVVAAVGLTRLESSTEFADMFPANSQAIRSLRWTEKHLGSDTALECLVEFPVEPHSRPSGLLARMELLERVQHRLASSANIGPTVSALSYLPHVPRGAGTRNTIRRAVLKRKVEASFNELQRQGVLCVDSHAEVWRITTRLAGAPGGSFSSVCQELHQLFRAAQADYDQMHAPLMASLQITGYQLVAERARNALLNDLATSFVTAFLLITPMMMLIVGSIAHGFLLMIPSVLPVVLVFGCLGWFGIRLDVAGILTASVALGIAVDDTLHFISWFMRVRRSGRSPAFSVLSAMHVCARPMVTTTLICSGAMLPFFFCSFLPTSKFAALLILILLGAIVGDLILLPAMLQSPLGRGVGRVRERAGALAAGRRQVFISNSIVEPDFVSKKYD